MELEETMYWLELLQDSLSAPDAMVTSIMRETSELTAIFVTVIKNAKDT